MLITHIAQMPMFVVGINVVDQHANQGLRIQSRRQRQVIGQIMADDLRRLCQFRTFHTNLHVQTSRAKHGWINHVDTVRCANHHNIVKRFHTVKFGQKLRNNGCFHVR